MEASRRPDNPAEQGGPSPAPAEPSYSEAWGYFYLGRTQPRHRMMSTWATCRLCGEQVGGLPSFQLWTRALWRHLSDAHLQELKKSAALSAPPSPMSVESDWARLLEQMGELVMRGSRRELELEQREAALKQAELVLERKRQALQQEELIMVQERHQLQMEREALSEWMKKHSPNAEVPAPPSPLPLPPREDPDTHLDDGHH